MPGVGDTPNKHDILTGTMPDGRAFPAGEDRTCSNWASNADGRGRGHAVVLTKFDRLTLAAPKSVSAIGRSRDRLARYLLLATSGWDTMRR